MKLNSIRFKFLSIIISSTLAITVIIGGLSIYEVDQFIQRQTVDYINVTCERDATEINDIFGNMQQSVNIMSSYILDFFDTISQLQNRELLDEIIKYSEKMFTDVANNTIGTVAYYLRFSPEISDGQTGFFFSKTKRTNQYLRFAPTDLNLYDRNDTEHVGWYWQPYDAGKPVWMMPYHNKNNDIMMISYVVPLYCEGQFIGVVGMDFDYTVLSNKVKEIKIYENGFAHLEIDGVNIHNDNDSISYSAEDYLQVSRGLTNGMTLVLSASYDDIQQIRYDIGFRILFIVLILSTIFCIVTIIIGDKIVKPLNLLTEASKKLADGDYEVEHIRSDTYEIQLLSTAFEQMTLQLREHEKLQHLLAYRDSLTGLRNTTSYKVWVTDFNNEIKKNNTEFGVIIFDVNYLKETNDKYGHDIGNTLIVAVAQIISKVFKRSPVFRIGGDEFLVILQNSDLEAYDALCIEFDQACANEVINVENVTIPISIARGFAKYDSEKDRQFVDVFNRADDAMYKHKRMMKSAKKF